MHSDTLLDSGDEFEDAVKRTALQTLSANVAEETLDHVEPGGRSGREVNVKAQMLLEPTAHLGVVMRPVVVHDQVQLLMRGCLALDLAQKRQPPVMAMTFLQLEITASRTA